MHGDPINSALILCFLPPFSAYFYLTAVTIQLLHILYLYKQHMTACVCIIASLSCARMTFKRQRVFFFAVRKITDSLSLIFLNCLFIYAHIVKRVEGGNYERKRERERNPHTTDWSGRVRSCLPCSLIYTSRVITASLFYLLKIIPYTITCWSNPRGQQQPVRSRPR